MNAVFLDYDTVSMGDLDTSALRRIMPALKLLEDVSESRIAAHLADAEIVLINRLALSRERLLGAPRLKLIALAATGTDNVDLSAAQQLGIAVCNVRRYCTASVVQLVWGMILALTHHLADYRRLAAAGDWRAAQRLPLIQPMRELAGRRLGVIGWGELGRAVAKAGAGVGMEVVVANRRGGAPQGGRLDLDEFLRVADVVSLHCPLSDGNRGMIGARELSLMKPDALLINTARGALIDGRALAEALKSHRLGGAGIDVLAVEPPAADEPLLDPDIPNLLLTPHMGWAAREARQRCLDEMAANIRDFMAGKRRGRVV